MTLLVFEDMVTVDIAKVSFYYKFLVFLSVVEI